MTAHHDNDTDRLRTLDARATEQRRRFLGSLKTAGDRLRPSSLANDAGNRMLDFGLDSLERARTAARRNPLKTAGAVAAVVAFLARGPLLKGLGMALTAGFRHVRRARNNRADIAPESEDGHEQQ